MLYSILFKSDYLLFSKKSVPLQCVFHSIRFKVNKGWSKALLLFYFIPLTFTIKQVFLLIQKPGQRIFLVGKLSFKRIA